MTTINEFIKNACDQYADETCSACGGTGRILFESGDVNIHCEICEGSGREFNFPVFKHELEVVKEEELRRDIILECWGAYFAKAYYIALTQRDTAKCLAIVQNCFELLNDDESEWLKDNKITMAEFMVILFNSSQPFDYLKGTHCFYS